MNHLPAHPASFAAARRRALRDARCLAAFALSIGMALAAWAPAAHSHTVETRTAVVRFGDLDLTRPDDVAALHARLRRAARAVCALEPLPSANAYPARHCYVRALDRALVDARSATANAHQRLAALERHDS